LFGAPQLSHRFSVMSIPDLQQKCNDVPGATDAFKEFEKQVTDNITDDQITKAAEHARSLGVELKGFK